MNVAIRLAIGITIDSPEIHFSRSSRTRV